MEILLKVIIRLFILSFITEAVVMWIMVFAGDDRDDGRDDHGKT